MMIKRNLFRLLFTTMAVITVILISGCIQEKPEKEGKLSSENFFYIDHHIHTHGELIEGKYVGLDIDFPTYFFDEKTGTLSGMIDFDNNKTLKIIYGNGISLSGVAGGGEGTRLSGVYELPYERNELKILKIDPNGTVFLEYKNESIILEGGEVWTNITSQIDTQQFGDQKGKANLIITDKIVNYGIFDKSKIEPW